VARYQKAWRERERRTKSYLSKMLKSASTCTQLSNCGIVLEPPCVWTRFGRDNMQPASARANSSPIRFSGMSAVAPTRPWPTPFHLLRQSGAGLERPPSGVGWRSPNNTLADWQSLSLSPPPPRRKREPLNASDLILVIGWGHPRGCQPARVEPSAKSL